MFYVYILKSINFPDQAYIGCTNNLRDRLATHNAGQSVHTNKYKPWAVEAYVAIKDKNAAFDFEQYLKSSSGRQFINKRLIGSTRPM